MPNQQEAMLESLISDVISLALELVFKNRPIARRHGEFEDISRWQRPRRPTHQFPKIWYSSRSQIFKINRNISDSRRPLSNRAGRYDFL